MPTKIIQKNKRFANSRPAQQAQKIKFRMLITLGVCLLTLMAPIALLIADVWVPGLAWLE